MDDRYITQFLKHKHWKGVPEYCEYEVKLRLDVGQYEEQCRLHQELAKSACA